MDNNHTPPGNDNSNPNPYAPPSASLDDQAQDFANTLNFIPEGQVIPAGMASELYGVAWNTFKRQPWAWIGITLVFTLLVALTGCIPAGGQVMAALLLGGFMIACARFWDTGVVEIGDLFAGFQTHGAPLAIFGLIQAAFVYTIHGPFAVAELVLTLTSGHFHQYLLTIKILSAVTQIIGIFIVGLSNFAGPALIVFHGFKPFDAFKTSISAWIKNWTFGLLFWLFSIIVMICGIIACCFGVFVALPLSFIASFLAYRAVFLADSRSDY
jgi:hypothetical protein